jgi:hypothetical protein
MDVGRYIFIFVFALVFMTLHDRFFPNWFSRNRQPHVWFAYWRPNVMVAFFSVLVSLFLNTVLGR